MSDICALARRAVGEWGATQKPEELAALGGLVRERGCRSVLEIGTYSGGTARFFRALGCEVEAIDIDLGHLRSDALASGVRFYEADSRTAPPGRWDVVFIDADHSLAGVRGDWERFGPCATSLVAFHDVREHLGAWGGLSQVKVLWDELKASGVQTTEFIFGDEPYAGIGVTFCQVNEEEPCPRQQI